MLVFAILVMKFVLCENVGFELTQTQTDECAVKGATVPQHRTSIIILVEASRDLNSDCDR